MKVRRIPRTPPKRPASKTTLSRGEAWPGPGAGDAGGVTVVQSSCANTKAAKSTSCASSTSRSSVVVPGLKDVVQGSTCATSSRPRVNACSSFSCFPDEPRKMRGLFIQSPGEDGGYPLRPDRKVAPGFVKDRHPGSILPSDQRRFHAPKFATLPRASYASLPSSHAC